MGGEGMIHTVIEERGQEGLLSDELLSASTAEKRLLYTTVRDH